MKPGMFTHWGAALTLALSLTLAPAAHADLLDDVPGGTVNWTDGIIEVTGTGIMPETGSLAQKRLMGYRAAIADAYRKLAEATSGVRVDAETTVANYVTTSDVIRTQVNGLIKGAQAGKATYKPDGSVEVKLTLDLYGKGRPLASVVVPARQPDAPPVIPTSATPTAGGPAPAGSSAPVTPTPVTEDYTGVIIDAKGLKAEPAMGPSLLDETGRELYLGDLPANPDEVIERGIASYAASVDEAKTLKGRVGNKPLILKAKAVKGPQRADLVLDRAAAGLLLGADQRKAFLSTFNVIIVL